MSDADGGVEPVTIDRDGFHVEKSVEPTEDDVSQVVVRVTSDRDESARLRVVDQVPATVPQHSVGLHPDHRDAWDVEDGALVLETEVSPGETLETLYGVDSTDPTVLQAFSQSPSVTVEPTDDGAGAGGDDPFDPALDEETDDGPLLRGGSAAAETEEAVATDGSWTRVGDEPDVAAIVEAVEAADEDQREALREALMDGQSVGRSFDARLGSLQRKVADLTAYSEALEGFIDENGGAQEIIERVESDLETVREVAGDAATRADEAFETAAEAEGSVDALETTVDEVHADVSDLDDAVGDAETRLDDLVGEVSALREDVATLAEELRATRRWQARVADAAGERDGDGLDDLRIDAEQGEADATAAGAADEDPIGDLGDAEADGAAQSTEEPDGADQLGDAEAEDDPLGGVGAAADPIGDLDGGDDAATDDSDDSSEDPLSGIDDA